jgi:hypothetical protein
MNRPFRRYAHLARLAGCSLLVVCLNSSIPQQATTAFAAVANWWQRGISYVAYEPGLYSSAESDQSLTTLAATGANWISLIVTCYQDTISSTTISCPPAMTPSDSDLIHVIQKARSLNLKVMLRPIVDLSNDATHWRGEIDFGSDQNLWAQWFNAYRAFIVRYAQLAQAYGVEQFCVGVELEGTVSQESQWRQTIASVRAVYTGPLTYSANFDGFMNVLFWDSLNFIGIDAYFGLTNKTNPTLSELKAAWAPHVTALQALSQQWSKPILFTEVGYRSVDGTNIAPWDWVSNGPTDLSEQADCYQALFETFQDQPWMGGMFIWAWGTDPNQGGPSDTYYSPHNKPAATVLSSYYTLTESESVMRIHENGATFTDGAYSCGRNGDCFNSANGADLAEGIRTSEPVEPGDLVELDPEHPRYYRKSRSAYSQLVAGVISSRPGLLMAANERTSHHTILALVGRVAVKATAENGPINPGDLLVSAAQSGYAMRCPLASRCEGAVFGKALETLNQGQGLVLVLVMSH